MDGGRAPIDLHSVQAQLIELREAVEHLVGAVTELSATRSIVGRSGSPQQVRAQHAMEAAVASLSRLRDLQNRQGLGPDRG